MEEEQLKDCPFCGSNDLSVDYWLVAGHKEYSVICNGCGAAGPFELLMSEAGDAWNMRKPMERVCAAHKVELGIEMGFNDIFRKLYGPAKRNLMAETE